MVVTPAAGNGGTGEQNTIVSEMPKHVEMRAAGGASASARRCLALAAAVAVAASVGGCDESPTGPSSGAIATFRVVNETFRVLLTTPEQIASARAAQAGGRASIPVGRIAAGTQVNTGWSWHLEDVTFAEVAIEVCDGLPSHVEREGTSFAMGTYCPWGAIVIAIEER